jgi:hypothetical protein
MKVVSANPVVATPSIDSSLQSRLQFQLPTRHATHDAIPHAKASVYGTASVFGFPQMRPVAPQQVTPFNPLTKERKVLHEKLQCVHRT